MQEIKLGELGKIKYDRVGTIEFSHPFIISSSKIITAFVYDLFQKKFVSAELVNHDAKTMKFEIEPNDHAVFLISCSDRTCELKVYNMHVRSDTVNYDGYEQYETLGVTVDEVYSTTFDRSDFRYLGLYEGVPDILGFITAFLVPINLPDTYFRYIDVNEIIEDLKNFLSHN